MVARILVEEVQINFFKPVSREGGQMFRKFCLSSQIHL